MAGRSNARTLKQESAEILALRLIDLDGEPATRLTVQAAMDRWRSHPQECRCELCGRARTVSVSHVWMTVWAWQQSVARTRRLARR